MDSTHFIYDYMVLDEFVNEQMDGWVDKGKCIVLQVDGWKGGWMDRQTNDWIDEWTDGWLNVEVNGWAKNGWGIESMNGCVVGQISRWMTERMDMWLDY